MRIQHGDSGWMPRARRYDIQPVKPPAGAVPFHGLGRDNQYALPAPYDYNCPKDYTRRSRRTGFQPGTHEKEG